MSRLSPDERERLIRSGEDMQWMQNIGGVPVMMQAHMPKAMPPGSVGDVNSDAKGSGARYNAGKVPYELVPVVIMADYFVHAAGCEPAQVPEPVDALCALGEFQARSGEDHDTLLDVLRYLGQEGWEECARVFDYGRAKYAAWNWAKGMDWSIPIACATRHLLAMIDGEEIDPESGQPHRGHVFCNVVMLYTFGSTFPEGDDRPPAGRLSK